MQLANLINMLEKIAPLDGAESWDNVGLLVGDPQQNVSRAMLTIDYTPEVATEAAERKCDAIIAYHPPIFSPLKRLVAPSLVFDAIARGVAIYSPHTALDVAAGGTNDALADVLMLVDRKPLKLRTSAATQCKLVTFVPPAHLSTVADALFAAGAGTIGDYSSCSFQSSGTGTFFGNPGTRPSVGEAGTFQRVDETRLETVVDLSKIEPVLAALRKSHPYGEPAFDLVMLHAPPTAIGIGRIGKLPGDVTADMLVNHVKRELSIDRVLIAGDAKRSVRRAAVCAGSGGSLLDEAIAQRADFFLTGELRHHDALRAVEHGFTVVCTLHSNSERFALKILRERLVKELNGIDFTLSERDRDPFRIE